MILFYTDEYVFVGLSMIICMFFIYFKQLLSNTSTTTVQLCTADRKQGAKGSPRHLKQSHYGHSISLCILQCSVKTQCRLPPMFVTVLCTIEISKALLKANIDNKASVLPASLDASTRQTTAASVWNFIFTQNGISDGICWREKGKKTRIG